MPIIECVNNINLYLGVDIMHTLDNLLAIADFLGDDMTEMQASELMDEARQLSIADREILLNSIPGNYFYTELSMHDGEMGGLDRY